jgi:hypothetical protein
LICLIANLSSIPFDYIARNKISGQHFSQFIVEQLPVFSPKTYNKLLYDEIKSRVLELVYTSLDMKSFSIDFDSSKKIPVKWNSEKRHKLQSELDAIFALMYSFTKEDLYYILDTFNVLRKEELKEFGEYKTKNQILSFYDKFNSDPELGPLFRLEGVDLEKLKGE